MLVTSGAFRDFYRRIIGMRDPFVLTNVSSHFIRKQLLALNPKKAVGLDDISFLFCFLSSGFKQASFTTFQKGLQSGRR